MDKKNVAVLFHKIFRNARGALSFSFARENCLCCGRTTFGMPLCRSCGQKLTDSFEKDLGRRCSVCGRELLSERGVCTKCRVANLFSNTDGVFPVFPYRLWIKKLVFEWKMGGRRSLSPVFALVIKKALDSLGLSPDTSFLVPVPPRPGKVRKKGWDQVDEVCGLLGSLYGFRILKVLRRLTVDQQKKKDRGQRLDSKWKSYGLAADWEKRIRNCSRKNDKGIPLVAVIIDDVITTGATVDSCAKILKDIGIGTVRTVSLVIVD